MVHTRPENQNLVMIEPKSRIVRSTFSLPGGTADAQDSGAPAAAAVPESQVGSPVKQTLGVAQAPFCHAAAVRRCQILPGLWCSDARATTQVHQDP